MDDEATTRTLGAPSTDAGHAYLLVRRVGHDLRAPLNAILGFSTLLEQGVSGPMTEEQRRQATMIHEAGKRLLALVDDLAEVARIETGALRPQMRPVKARTVLERAEKALRGVAGPDGPAISIDCEDLPLETDATLLADAVVRLVHEAIGHEGVRSIRVTVCHAGEDDVALAVDDDGEGFDPLTLDAELDEVAARRTPPAGTGLELAVASRIVYALGGVLTVWSRPGRGTRARIRMPRMAERRVAA